MGIPKYQSIAQTLKDQILQNTSIEPVKLPTEQMLCHSFHCSRQTIRMALSILEQEQLITKQQGSGAYTNPTHYTHQEQKIAIIFPTDSEYLDPSLLTSIQHALRQSHFSYATYLTEHNPNKERTILKSLLQDHVQGIIILTQQTNVPSANLDLFLQIEAIHIPIVFLNATYLNLPHFSSLQIDHFDGGQQAGHYLLNAHHTNITGIFQLDNQEGIQKNLGLQTFLQDNAQYTTCWYQAKDFISLQKKQDTGFLKYLIQKELSSCSAIVCQNDEIAYWLIKELTLAKFHIPDDINVISFDCSYLSELSQIPITSFTLKPHDLSSEIISNLIDKINHVAHKDMIFTWSLIEKQTTSKLMY